MSAIGLLRKAWRTLPPDRRLWAQPALRTAMDLYVRAAARRPHGADRPEGPLKIVGFFSGSHGIAASARLALRAFDALGVPVETVDVSDAHMDWTGRLTQPQSASAWMFHLNPPELAAVLAYLGPRQVVGPRYAYWAWELAKAPRRWLADRGLADEVWAPSRFTADALGGARVVPHPLFLEDYAGITPAPRRAPFQAVALFDMNSSAARKNPAGAIEAFHRAFGDDPNARLVIKAQNGARAPEVMAKLRASAPANVEIIDAVWPYSEVLSLIRGADALISLHRAEGFGLTLAEAMALGVPVVATAYSGNLDFMDETAACLVPYRLTPVRDPQPVYAGYGDQTWADPDLDAAASALRRLRDEPALAARLSAAGRRLAAQRLSPAAWFETLPPQLQDAARAARDQAAG